MVWVVHIHYPYYCTEITSIVFTIYLLILSEERDISLCNVHELKALCRCGSVGGKSVCQGKNNSNLLLIVTF